MKYLIFGLILLLFFPLYWMFTGSIQPSAGILKIPPNWIPRNVTLSNFTELIKGTQTFRWTFNTLIINTFLLSLQLFCLVTASYAFAMYRFIGKRLIYWIFIASIIVPWQSIIVSRFVLMRHLHLINTWLAIICISAFNPVGVVLIKNYFDKIPRTIIDSARIDGADELWILFKIVLPQCKPILGYIAITSYILAFQEFFWPMLVLHEKRLFTLPLGIMYYLKTYASTHGWINVQRVIGLQLAGSVLLFLPVIFIFLIFRKTFQQQFVGEGIKE